MENQNTNSEVDKKIIEPLFEKAEQYGRTSLELLKLKSIDKTSDLISTFINYSILIVFFSFFLILLNISISLWIGILLGNYYLGFLIVSFFYFFISVIFFLLRKIIKVKINNSIIAKLVN